MERRGEKLYWLPYYQIRPSAGTRRESAGSTMRRGTRQWGAAHMDRTELEDAYLKMRDENHDLRKALRTAEQERTEYEKEASILAAWGAE